MLLPPFPLLEQIVFFILLLQMVAAGVGLVLGVTVDLAEEEQVLVLMVVLQHLGKVALEETVQRLLVAAAGVQSQGVPRPLV